MSSDVPKHSRLPAAPPAGVDQGDILELAQGLARLLILDWEVSSDSLSWRSSPGWLLGPAPRGGYLPFREMVHQEDRSHFLRSRMQSEEFVFRVVRTDGEVTWVAARAKPYVGADGRPERVVAVLQDISDRKRVELELREQREHLQMVHEVAGLHSVEWEIGEDRLIWNDDPEPILGELPASGRYPLYTQMVHPDDRELFLARRDGALSGAGPETQEFRIIRTDGEIRWLSVRQRVLDSRAARPGRTRIAIQDISEREHLAFLAQHDVVTGLPNRSLFQDRLRQGLARGCRESRRIAVMFLDLDRFKEVNDTFGHDVGDVLLKEVGARLTQCLRKVDTVARLGGDEFTVIIEGFKERAQVTRVAQKILGTLCEPFDVNGKRISISGSIGIALHPDDALTEQDLLRRADEAMYRAKQERNHFRYASG